MLSAHPLTCSKSALPLTATNAISGGRLGETPENKLCELAASSAGCSSELDRVVSTSPSGVGGFRGASCGSLRGRNMTYALTNADGLNLGRQTGRYDAVAELLRIDGEWMVLMRM